MGLKHCSLNNIEYHYSIQKCLQQYTLTIYHNNTAQHQMIINNVKSFQKNGNFFTRFTINKQRYQAIVIANDLSDTKTHIRINNQVNFLKLLDKSIIQHNTTPQYDHSRMLKSPLDGRISKLLVKNNQTIKQNEPIIIIESMKMENIISAPYTASIKNLLVQEQNVVHVNQVLIEFCEHTHKGESGAEEKIKYDTKETSHR